jgi:hypothetical protein
MLPFKLPVLIFLILAFSPSKLLLLLLFTVVCIAAIALASLLLLDSIRRFFHAKQFEGSFAHRRHHHLKGARNSVESRKKTCLKKTTTTATTTATKTKRVSFSEPISFELAAPVIYEDEKEGNVEASDVHGRFTASFWF